jgi:tight adherence protein C
MNPVLMLAGGFSAVLISAAALLLIRQSSTSEAFAARVELARGHGMAAAARRQTVDHTAPLRLVAGLGLAIVRSGLLSARTLAELEQTLVASGFRAENAIGVFVGSKILLLLTLAGLAFLLVPYSVDPTMRHLGVGVAAIIGLLAPDKIVHNIRDRYRRKLERGLADALDMMVICSQAGLGLESAIARVAIEIRFAHPEIAHEFALTASEMQLMADSRAALQRMGDRTGLQSLRRFTTTLVQSAQYGTPLSDAMRGLAAEMRQEALTAFEERAARLSVILTVPMILNILPCVMIVVAGPAIIQLLKVLAR